MSLSSLQKNYYEILGVLPQAKKDEIRDAYRKLILKVHPDRNGLAYSTTNKDNDSENQETSTSESASSDSGSGATESTSSDAKPKDSEMNADSAAANGKEKDNAKLSCSSPTTNDPNHLFYKVHQAYETLSNPGRRLFYDIRLFGCTKEMESELINLEKGQANADIHAIQDYYRKCFKKELKVKGMIIMDAWYGDVSVLKTFSILYNPKSKKEAQKGKFQLQPIIPNPDAYVTDVKTATQCLIDTKQHRLIISGGANTSRADLKGYYNPVPYLHREKVTLGLYMRYQFNDEVHEVLVNDREPVYCPKKSQSIASIVKKIKKEEETRKKRKKEEQILSIDPIHGNLMLFALFSTLLVFQERQTIMQSTSSWNTNGKLALLKQPLETIGRFFKNSALTTTLANRF